MHEGVVVLYLTALPSTGCKSYFDIIKDFAVIQCMGTAFWHTLFWHAGTFFIMPAYFQHSFIRCAFQQLLVSKKHWIS